MAKRKQTTTFIFEQQLKGEYWDLSNEKKALFDIWKSYKQEIFQEIIKGKLTKDDIFVNIFVGL